VSALDNLCGYYRSDASPEGSFKGPRRLVEFIALQQPPDRECSALPDLGQAVLLMEKYADTPMDFAGRNADPAR